VSETVNGYADKINAHCQDRFKGNLRLGGIRDQALERTRCEPPGQGKGIKKELQDMKRTRKGTTESGEVYPKPRGGVTEPQHTLTGKEDVSRKFKKKDKERN